MVRGVQVDESAVDEGTPSDWRPGLSNNIVPELFDPTVLEAGVTVQEANMGNPVLVPPL